MFRINRKTIYILALLTLFGFSLLGWAIFLWFYDKPFEAIFESNYSWYWQIPLGFGYGFIVAFIALSIIKSNLLESVREFFTDLLQKLQLRIYDIFFISFCAGVGEEILFRGAIQETLGIWLTAILFIALHGYINPRNWSLCLYGLFMIVLSAGLGYLYEYIGLLSAITAHFTIDVVLLWKMQKNEL